MAAYSADSPNTVVSHQFVVSRKSTTATTKQATSMLVYGRPPTSKNPAAKDRSMPNAFRMQSVSTSKGTGTTGGAVALRSTESKPKDRSTVSKSASSKGQPTAAALPEQQDVKKKSKAAGGLFHFIRPNGSHVIRISKREELERIIYDGQYVVVNETQRIFVGKLLVDQEIVVKDWAGLWVKINQDDARAGIGRHSDVTMITFDNGKEQRVYDAKDRAGDTGIKMKYNGNIRVFFDYGEDSE